MRKSIVVKIKEYMYILNKIDTKAKRKIKVEVKKEENIIGVKIGKSKDLRGRKKIYERSVLLPVFLFFFFSPLTTLPVIFFFD